MLIVQVIRIVFFYLLLFVSVFVWGIFSFFIVLILLFCVCYCFVVQNWCCFVIWLICVVVGICYEVCGLENILEKFCVIFFKYQSIWEIFFFFGFFELFSQVFKCELFYVLFFGWVLVLFKFIVIDCSQFKLVFK